jgi:superfamily II DNA helicase RecQ
MPQNKKFNGATIIYCQTKKLTGQIKDLLVNFGIKCDCYHADLKMSERKAIQKKFLADEIDVIIATVAFGMGIDKPDIRNVIHYGAPKDLESNTYSNKFI